MLTSTLTVSHFVGIFLSIPLANGLADRLSQASTISNIFSGVCYQQVDTSKKGVETLTASFLESQYSRVVVYCLFSENAFLRQRAVDHIAAIHSPVILFWQTAGIHYENVDESIAAFIFSSKYPCSRKSILPKAARKIASSNSSERSVYLYVVQMCDPRIGLPMAWLQSMSRNQNDILSSGITIAVVDSFFEAEMENSSVFDKCLLFVNRKIHHRRTERYTPELKEIISQVTSH